jgi:rubrerythrin
MISDDRAWRANWRREIEGAYLYRRLSEFARTPNVRRSLAQMADQEEAHAALWQQLIQSATAYTRPLAPICACVSLSGWHTGSEPRLF